MLFTTKRSRLKKGFEEVVRNLESKGDSRAIANFLYEKEVRGIRKSSTMCPVSLYVREALKEYGDHDYSIRTRSEYVNPYALGRELLVTVDTYAILRSKWTVQGGCDLQKFVRDFDNQLYPELDITVRDPRSIPKAAPRSTTKEED